MNKVAALLLAALLTGCAQVGAPVPVLNEKPVVAKPPAQAQPAAPAATVVPREDQVCIKPADQSGITFRLLPPQSDGSMEAKPGWVIVRPAVQVMGYVAFPKAVDLASVKLSIDPAADWTYQTQPTNGLPDTIAIFNFLPAGGNMAEPLEMQWGKPGWITLTVESARGKDGSDLLTKPATLKMFAFNQEMQDTHPYLGKCYSGLEVSPGPNGP